MDPLRRLSWVSRLVLAFVPGSGLVRVGVERIPGDCPCTAPPRSIVLTARRGMGRPTADLLTVLSAQQEFRRVRGSYWREDIAGLYLDEGPPERWLKFIYLSIAGADASPKVPIERAATRSAKSGYGFRSLSHEGEREPSPDQFAVVAHHDGGLRPCVFILDERGEIYHGLQSKVGIPKVFPGEQVKQDWMKWGTWRPWEGNLTGPVAAVSIALCILLVGFMARAEPGSQQVFESFYALFLLLVGLLPWFAVVSFPVLALMHLFRMDARLQRRIPDPFLRGAAHVALSPVYGVGAALLCLLAWAGGPFGWAA